MNHKFASIAAALLFCLLLAEGIHHAQWTSATEAPPQGWEREPNEIPYKLAALRGDLPLHKGESSLDFYRTIYPINSEPIDTLSLQVSLPDDGQLEVWLSSPPRRVRDGNRWINPCNKDASHPRCGGRAKFGIGVRIERIGESSINAVHANAQNERVLKCEGTPPAIKDEPFSLKIDKQPYGFDYSVGDQKISCRTQTGDRPPQIRPGLREVHISQLSINDGLVPPSTPSRLSAYSISALGIFSLIGLLRLLQTPWRYCLLTMVPIAFCPLLIMMDWKSWIETMRAAWLPYHWMPVFLSYGSTVMLCLFATAFQLARRRIGRWSDLIGILLLGIQIPLIFHINSVHSTIWLIVFLLPIVLRFLDRRSPTNAIFVTTAFSLLGSLLGLSVGVNARHALGASALLFSSFGCLSWLQAKAQQIKGYNILSLLFVGLMVFAAEGVLSGTSAGHQWSAAGARTEKNDLFGWVNTANEGFALLEEGEHTTYPDKGYPIAINTTISSKHRIVSFGGSTTGGAFQNDNLDQFYPSKLGRKLGPQYESINQGVGGWTTFHIARYIDLHAEDLKPDTAIFYVGHNDLLTATPLPYKDLYRLWEKNPKGKKFGAMFERFHLYHALRHILVSLRPAAQRAAVPVPHARENLESIFENLKPYDSRILLVSEGLAPDPGPLSSYNILLKSLSEEYESVSFLDAATQFHDYPSSQIFLDDCHLSDYGHDLLSSWLESEIQIGETDATNP